MGTFILSAEYISGPSVKLDCRNGCYHILCITEGSVDYIIDKKLYHAVGGQSFFWGPACQPSVVYASSDYKRYVIRVREFLPHEIVRDQKLYTLLQHYSESPTKVLDFAEYKSDIQSSFERIVKEVASDLEWKEDILNLLLRELLMRLYRMDSKSIAENQEGNEDIAARVHNLLETQYHKSYTLTELARSHGISVSYLSHIFREHYGTSPIRYLLDCRMAAAKRYLSKTDLAISEIVELSGFTDFSNFSRTFKREVGCSPTQYRQRANKKMPQEGG